MTKKGATPKRKIEKIVETKHDRVFLPMAVFFAILGYFSLTVLANSKEIAVLRAREESTKTYLKRIEGEVLLLRLSFNKLNEILIKK